MISFIPDPQLHLPKGKYWDRHSALIWYQQEINNGSFIKCTVQKCSKVYRQISLRPLQNREINSVSELQCDESGSENDLTGTPVKAGGLSQVVDVNGTVLQIPTILGMGIVCLHFWRKWHRSNTKLSENDWLLLDVRRYDAILLRYWSEWLKTVNSCQLALGGGGLVENNLSYRKHNSGQVKFKVCYRGDRQFHLSLFLEQKTQSFLKLILLTPSFNLTHVQEHLLVFSVV